MSTPPPPPPGPPHPPTPPRPPAIRPHLTARAEAIFDAVLDIPEEKREGFLVAVCGDDDVLLQRIRALLAARTAAPDFLEVSPLSPEIEAELARLKPEEGGEMIGPYKLREQIGEGGFGAVWVADQEKPVRRRVALKIIKMGMDTKEVIARFEQERQALAMMDHPNIARVFDAGATEHGRPYFVMELVRGVKITDYCDEKQLSTRERIELFIPVCQAVQHAHQKGIIHRDLKPSNILVSINDGSAVVKVIDFGVAKATQGRLTAQTVYTHFQQMIGTPLYMSPEQAQMTSLDVDTRSDIYSLGVLLYELLTGQTPIEQDTLARAGLDEIRRIIREVEPPRPSMRVRALDAAELTPTAKRRNTEPATLPGILRGDLDWIVMKCLEKDRARRYETAHGLALDLQRHLKTEPIIARPASMGYKLQKALRRNRLAITATAAIVFVLALFASLVPWQEKWHQVKFFAPDWQTRIGAKTPVDNRLVLIGIDQTSFTPHFSDEELQREPALKALQGKPASFPWSRALYAPLIEKLSDAGAKVIILNILFIQQLPGDEALHRSLEKYKDRVVIAYNLSDGINSNTGRSEAELGLPSSSILTPSGTNSAVDDDRLGYVNLWPDSDFTIRRASFRRTGAQLDNIVPKETILESVAARALRKFGRPDLIPPGVDGRLFRYTARANQTFKPESFSEVLSPKRWEEKYDNGKFFEDKIVLIGPTTEFVQDGFKTPFTDPKSMGGSEIHLQIINAALQEELFGERSPVTNLLIIAMTAVIAVALCFLVRHPGMRFVSFVGLCVGYVVFAQLLFDHAGQVIPLEVPLLVLAVSSFIVLAYDLAVERPERTN